MKMLMLIYSGTNPQSVTSLLDDHCAGGYSVFNDVSGAGVTGKRDGTRAWPGKSTLFVSMVPELVAGELTEILRREVDRLPVGERLHVAVLPIETFF